MKPNTIFVDSEISTENGTIKDLGAITSNGDQFHSAKKADFSKFVSGAEYICGHNLLHHDLKYIGELLNTTNPPTIIDTLYISPLLFPKKPY